MEVAPSIKERPTGITIVAVLGLVLGPLAILGGILLALAFVAASEIPADFIIFPLLISAWGALAIPASIGLLAFARWGHLLSLAVAGLTLSSFPVGTASGIAVLWYLMRPEIRAVFLPGTFLPSTSPGPANTP